MFFRHISHRISGIIGLLGLFFLVSCGFEHSEKNACRSDKDCLGDRACTEGSCQNSFVNSSDQSNNGRDSSNRSDNPSSKDPTSSDDKVIGPSSDEFKVKAVASTEKLPASNGDVEPHVKLNCSAFGGDEIENYTWTLKGTDDYDERTFEKKQLTLPPGRIPVPLGSATCKVTFRDGNSTKNAKDTSRIPAVYEDDSTLAHVTPQIGIAGTDTSFELYCSHPNWPVYTWKIHKKKSQEIIGTYQKQDLTVSPERPGTYKAVCKQNLDSERQGLRTGFKIQKSSELSPFTALATASTYVSKIHESIELHCKQNLQIEGSSFKWRLDDGETKHGADIKHTYEEPGIYKPTCIIEGPTGRKANHSINIEVSK